MNDNAPKFSGYYIHMYIRENGPPFHLVGTLDATDKDEGPNAEIMYAMLLDSVDAYTFQIDFRTGDLHALNSLDREVQSEYRVTIRAASPPLFSQATLIIHVIDENDNLPVAYDSTVYLNFFGNYLPENRIVGRLGAKDPDILDKLTYVMQDAVYWDLFSLNRTTGVLYAHNRLLTHYIPREVIFTVEVSGRSRENANKWVLFIVDSSNTDLNSAWMCMGLRSVFDESTID